MGASPHHKFLLPSTCGSIWSIVRRLQLSAWLKRHEGRPGVAQSSMSEQLLDVPVTASREAEAKAYEVGGDRMCADIVSLRVSSAYLF